jgi:hypothetical protein
MDLEIGLDQRKALNISSVEPGLGKLDGISWRNRLDCVRDAGRNLCQIPRLATDGYAAPVWAVLRHQQQLAAHDVNELFLEAMQVIPANSTRTQFNAREIADSLGFIV